MDLSSTMKHGFNNVLNFSGRDGNRQFLVYFLITFGSLFLVSSLFFLEGVVNSVEVSKSAESITKHDWEGWWEFHDRKKQATDKADLAAGIAIAKFVFLGLLLPILLTVSTMVRRVHDVGYSGKWLLVVIPASLIVPFLPLILIVVLAVMKSDAAPNQFGDPT